MRSFRAAAGFLVLLACAPFTLASRSRRQIFREQVLPQAGGKIPEDAFRSDRLALNRLNKEGIAVPDGVLLESRHRESHFPSHRHDPDIDAAIIKLVQRPDGRYAPPEGRYPFDNLVESTYVIRPPISIHNYGGVPPRKPIQTTLQLPARPFFAEDQVEAGIDNDVDLLNTISHEFPGTRLWTGFGPLFHDTTNRILRQSGSKKLPDKENSIQTGNQQVNGRTVELHGTHSTSNNLGTEGISSGLPIITSTQTSLPARNKSQDGSLPFKKFQPTYAHQARLTEAGANGNPNKRPGVSDFIGAAAMAQVNAAIGQRSFPARTLRVVDGVLRSEYPAAKARFGGVQAIRPGPKRALETHLTAPPLGYPSLERIPSTSFVCRTNTRQMEADPQANCQVFHLCHPDGRKESFLCPTGSRYDAKANLCSPWTNVPCPSDT